MKQVDHLINEILLSNNLDTNQKLILINLIKCSKNNVVNKPIESLQLELNLSKRTIVRKLKSLCDIGLIKKHNNIIGRRYYANTYMLNLKSYAQGYTQDMHKRSGYFNRRKLAQPIYYSIFLTGSSYVTSSSYGNNINSKRNKTKKKFFFTRTQKATSSTTSDEVGIFLCKNVFNQETQMKENMEDVKLIFEFWQKTLNHPRAKLDAKLTAVIRRQLALYSVEELKQAIVGCSLSAFHRGDNEQGVVYDSLSLILRDSDHVARFMAMFERPPHPKIRESKPFTESERASAARKVTENYLKKTYSAGNFPARNLELVDDKDSTWH